MTDTITSVDPATLEELGTVDAASPGDVEAAVERARQAQAAWAAADVDERLEVLRRFQELVLESKRGIARLVTRETGKPVAEAMAADLFPVVDAVAFVAREGPGVLEEDLPLRNPMLMDRSSKIVLEPRGVVGVITPWNYPFGIPGSQLVYALFAGNAVVLKPSELTTLTALRLEELLLEAGLPEDLLQVVPGEGEPTGQALLEADVDYLLFTGSVRVGDVVRETCGPRGVPYCLELGGSDPALVLEDANLGMATDGITWARFTNAGQTCAAAKRVYAVEDVADEVTAELARKADALRVGVGVDPGVDMGPLVSQAGVEKIERQVEASVEMGATVLAGGERLEDVGERFYAPTVLVDVTPDMPVVQEETFGPVLPVMTVLDEDAAVEAANASPYGLTASVWTRDTDRGERVARRLDAGTVTVNDHTYTYAANETPWGGTGRSGVGHTHGVWGIRELTTLKHVNVASGETFPRSLRPRNLWWFPYPEDHADTFDEGLDWLYGDGLARKALKGPRILRKILGKSGLGDGEGTSPDQPEPKADAGEEPPDAQV